MKKALNKDYDLFVISPEGNVFYKKFDDNCDIELTDGQIRLDQLDESE